MIPATRLLYLLLYLAIIGLLASLWPTLESLWYTSISLIAFIAIADLSLQYSPLTLSAERHLPGSISLGVWQDVHLRLHNQGFWQRQITLFDHYPLQVQAQDLPQTFRLAAQQQAEIQYSIRAIERGKAHFPHIQIHLYSLLGLWKRTIKLPVESCTHIYPNFSAVAGYALLAADNQLSQIGILKKRRRGEGQDFHQLREHRKGDALRQIDWKATSRMNKLISREYQDERDQEVIFMIDCGQRMLSKDGELSHFDHTLNAVLLLSHVALKQGDSVGVTTFSGSERWLSPHKGHQALQHILNTLYDLQPSSQMPDYAEAVTRLMLRQKKRALVIVITNLRDEDSEDLLPALKILKQRHLVLLASMQEQILQDTLVQPIKNFDDALLYAATQHYMHYRIQAFERLQAHGILSLDVAPPALSIELINQYLDIKRSGKL